MSAVLLRWLMKRPVSLERLASLVSVFLIAKTVVAESPSAWWQPRSTSSLRCTRTAVCSLCFVTSGTGTSAAGQC